jgi:AcrR family transcriptional regulator
MNVNALDSFTREKILDVASAMIKEGGSKELRVDEVAEKANVDAATIEYFFDSRTQLIAEAQMSNYFEMIEPHHLVLARAETAAAIEDEPGFWSAIEENLRLAWCSGQVGDKWGIINLLHDVWSDPFSKGHFCELLDIQFERWINVIENAKRLGWIDQEMDAKAMITVFWSASVGQVITAGSTVLDLSPQTTRDFLMGVIRGRSHQESSFNS